MNERKINRMKLRKRILSMMLALALLMSFVPAVFAAPAEYTDVPATHWAYDAIMDVTEAGIFSGTGNQKFNPEGSMNRAMFVRALANLDGADTDDQAETPFRDVPAGKWYTGAIAWAYEQKVVFGVSKTVFGVTEAVTREQIAAFFYRYVTDLEDLDAGESGSLDDFADGDQVSTYARTAMEWAVGQKLLYGYENGTLGPRKTATRAEAAALFARFAAWVKDREQPVEPTEPTEPPVPVEPSEPTEPVMPTEPTVPSEPKVVTVTFRGENGYVKYRGEKVEQIQVSTEDEFVEFGIYGEKQNGYELDEAVASAGKMNRAGEIFILSDFDGDVTVDYTTRLMTMQVNFNIKPNYQNNFLDTPQKVTWGQRIARPETRRTGYHVSEWYTDTEYTQVYDFELPVKENLELYGQWEKDVYTVVYMVDGKEYSSVTAEYNSYLRAPRNPEKDGFVFNGWYRDPECTKPFSHSSDKILENITLYAGWVEAKLNYVYIDGSKGNDDNTGMTAADAVATFTRAKELLAGAAHKEIRVVGQIAVADEQVWDLSEYPGAVLLRDESFTNKYMFWVSATGKLTIRNMTVDGGAKYWAKDGQDFVSYMVFNCTGGSIILDSGAEFCNTTTKDSSTGAVAFLNGAHLTINDGAKIHDNVGGYSGAFGCSTSGASEIIMNGGEVYNNRATKKATSFTSTTPGGAFLLAGNSKTGYSVMTMNGGRIYNNAVASTADSTYGAGAIYLYTRAKFIMNGGEITGNTGICASAIASSGAKAQPSEVQLLGGRIYGNTITGERGGDFYQHNYSALILNGKKVLDGTIYLQEGANRQPVQITGALVDPLRLICGSAAYRDILVQGADYTLTEQDLAKIDLISKLDSHYRLTLDEAQNAIVIGTSQNIGVRIYLSSVGSDSNDGLTPDTAVATFAKAKALLKQHQSADGENIISILAGTVSSTPKVLSVTKDETWSLKDIPNAHVEVTEGTKGYMLYVTDGATLTLEDIVIDGSLYYNNAGATTLFRVTMSDELDAPRSVLNLKSGAVLQNCAAEVMYVYGGVLNMYDGAKITGVAKNRAVYATGMYLTNTGKDWSPQLNIYGGEIVDNTARCFEVLGAGELNIYGGTFARNVVATGGGAVISSTSPQVKIRIAGGDFRDNVLLGTTETSVGTIFYTTNAAQLTLAGGVFSGNVCTKAPQLNGFYSRESKDAAKSMVLTLDPAGKTLDLTNAPVFFNIAGDAGAVKIASALTGKVPVIYGAAPAAGTVLAAGTEQYRLTQTDLERFACTDESVKLTLDTENNRIVAAE